MIALAILLVSAPDAGAFTVNGINYSVSDGNATVTGATSKTITSLTIPATVTYNGTTYPVTVIRHDAFNNYASLRSVKIEDSDLPILCPPYTNGQNIDVHTSPFVNCPIEEYYIGRNLGLMLGTASVRGDFLQLASNVESVHVTFAGKTTVILSAAFFSIFEKQLSELTLGGDITTFFGNNCFSKAENLKTVNLLDGTYTLSSSLFPENPIENLNLIRTLPNTLNLKAKNVKFGDAWTEVPYEFCRDNSDLENLVLGANIVKIGNCAFVGCTNLKTVNFPENLKIIGESAFCDSKLLKNVEFNEGLEEIQYNAFGECEGLTKVVLPGSLKEVGSIAFSRASNIKEIIVESSPDNSPLNIEIAAFGSLNVVDKLILNRLISNKLSTQFKSVTFGDVWTEVPNEFLRDNTELENVELSVNTEKICNDAFMGCSKLSEIQFPAKLKVIGQAAFLDCIKLNNVTFNEGLEEIQYYAFGRCEGLTKIVLPGSLKKVENSAFAETINVKNVIVVPSADNSVLDNAYGVFGIQEIDKLVLNRVISSKLYAQFKSVTFGDAWTVIPEEFLRDQKILENVELGANIERIGDSAFYGCTSLKNILSLAKLPPVCQSDNTFDASNYENTTLTVPIGSRRAYAAAEVWKNFLSIKTDGVLAVTVEYDKSNGKVTLNGNDAERVELDEGEPLNVEITPALGFKIERVEVNGVNVMADLVDNTLNYDEISESLNIVVEFAPILFEVKVTDALTGGHIEINGETDIPETVQFGSRVEINAIPDTGYTLKSLEINGAEVTPDDKGIYVIDAVDSDLNIEAVFEIIRFKVNTVYDESMGTVKLNGSTETTEIDYGSTLTIDIEVTEGHYLESVIINGKDVAAEGNKVTIKDVTEDQNIEVNFDIYKYAVEAVFDSEYGSVTINGSETTAEVKWGTDASVVITPSYGYQIAKVTLDGKDVTDEVSAEGVYTIPSVKAACRLMVTFEIKRVRLTIAGIEGGVLTAIYDFGTEISYIPQAAEGWRFHSASFGDTVITELDEDGSFTVGPLTDNVILTVIFVDDSTALNDLKKDNSSIKVTAVNRTVTITGAPNGAAVDIYDTAGKIYYHGYDRVITLGESGVFIIKVSDSTFKFMLH